MKEQRGWKDGGGYSWKKEQVHEAWGESTWCPRYVRAQHWGYVCKVWPPGATETYKTSVSRALPQAEPSQPVPQIKFYLTQPHLFVCKAPGGCFGADIQDWTTEAETAWPTEHKTTGPFAGKVCSPQTREIWFPDVNGCFQKTLVPAFQHGRNGCKWGLLNAGGSCLES